MIQNCRLTHTMAHREEAATTLEAHGRRAPLAAGKIKPEATKGGGRGGGGEMNKRTFLFSGTLKETRY